MENVSADVAVRDVVRSGVHRLHGAISQLLAVATESSSGRVGSVGAGAVNAAFEDVSKRQRDLETALVLLRDHQRFQGRIQAESEKVRALDEEILGLSTELRDVQRGLEAEVFERAKPLLGKSLGKLQLRPFQSEDVLKYAHKLSYSTAAPPGWHFSQGLQIPIPFKPPAPQEDHMKQSFLFTNLEATLLARAKERLHPESKNEKEEEKLEEYQNVEDHQERETSGKRRKRKAASDRLEEASSVKRPVPPIERQKSSASNISEEGDMFDL